MKLAVYEDWKPRKYTVRLRAMTLSRHVRERRLRWLAICCLLCSSLSFSCVFDQAVQVVQRRDNLAIA